MTNAEKYEEIFGIKPDMTSCPTRKCVECPLYNTNTHLCGQDTRMWWVSDYKGVTNG